MPVATAGYSGKPLWQKLGLAEGQRLLLVDPPENHQQLLAGAPQSLARLVRPAEFDVAILFVTARAALAAALPRTLPHMAVGGMLWVAWPKKSSGLVTDVTEDVVRDAALPLGVVDVKVCAIDTRWSGLKFLRRRAGANSK